nr:MAG: ABC transporter permease [Hyphomicrobiales bacterium]
MRNGFSFARMNAVLIKEFVQMRRDRFTFSIMVMVPVMQLIIFGFAINTDPRALPTAVHVVDTGIYARSILAALRTSDYFDIRAEARTGDDATAMLDAGDVSFVVTIPVNFTRDLVRGDAPEILIEADASDPVASANALAAINALGLSALRDDLVGPLAIRASAPPFTTNVHRLYNPEGITQYNIVPGLIGVILTMTMVMVTAMAMTRERERGTLENLLAMPSHPLEVMLGKIIPYILVGYIQVFLVLMGAYFIFNVPMVGSLPLLIMAIGVFIAANLALGFAFSTIAKTQLQAMQMTVFFLLPSILLSGFMFPFRGMPQWAQWLGEALPNTHFLRVVRGILLKGNGVQEILPHIWPLALFLLVIGTVAMVRYRRTLD